MLMRRFLCFLYLLFTLTPRAEACVCINLGEDFFDTVSQHNNKVKSGEYPASDTLVIMTARVIKYQSAPHNVIPASMQLKVGQVIQGKVTDKIIWVDGDTDGTQCRPPVINFARNKNYIMAVQRDQANHFYVSGCGFYSKETESVVT